MPFRFRFGFTLSEAHRGSHWFDLGGSLRKTQLEELGNVGVDQGLWDDHSENHRDDIFSINREKLPMVIWGQEDESTPMPYIHVGCAFFCRGYPLFWSF